MCKAVMVTIVSPLLGASIGKCKLLGNQFLTPPNGSHTVKSEGPQGAGFRSWNLSNEGKINVETARSREKRKCRVHEMQTVFNSGAPVGALGFTGTTAWTAVTDLLAEKKKYLRDQYESPECVLTGLGSTFQIIRAQTDEQIAQGYQLLCENLSKAEVEPLDRLMHNVKGVNLCGRETCYRLFLAVNQEGLVVAAYAGSLMDIGGDHAVFIGTYAATRSCHMRRGLMKELFISGLMQAVLDAHNLGEELVLIIGDCTQASEPMWNAVGRRRLCMSTIAGIKEVDFLQPAIRFDLATGLPAAGLEPVKEHLMVRSLGPDITKELIIRAVDAYYRWCGKRGPEDFGTRDAYQQYREHFDGLLAQFKNGLYAGGELQLFSAAERKATIQQGVVFL